jgi:amidophosphoribosyltransferase
MCGVLGIYAKRISDIKSIAYYGMLGIQHRGQEAAGLAYHSSDIDRYTKKEVTQIFRVEGSVERLFRRINLDIKNNITLLGHTRYSTSGSSNINNIHPFLLHTVKGSISLVHNGNLTNTLILKDLANKLDVKLQGETDSEIILTLISFYWNKDDASTLEDSIIKVINLCEGSFNLIIGVCGKMYVYRDPSSNRPLVEGIYKDEDNSLAYIITSETSTLDIINADYTKDIAPGVLFSYSEKNNGGEILYKNAIVNTKRCIFENIYFSRPDSIVEEESLYEYRYRLGERLAQVNPVSADLVIGVPDSGLTGAQGYSNFSGIKYTQGFIKNRYIGRTFIQPTQKMRQEGIKVKLNVIPNILKDKRIVLVDDSIVRGNTSKIIISNLRKAGAKEIHIRLTSPPIINGCNLGMDFPCSSKLLAFNKSLGEICEFINADSIGYLSVEDILELTPSKNPKLYCTGCFNGKYLD